MFPIQLDILLDADRPDQVRSIFTPVACPQGVNPASAIRQTKNGMEVDLLVSPGSGRSEVQTIDPWRKRLIVKLIAPPEKGEANQELESLLTAFFGARTEVIRGHANRMKTVLVASSKESILTKLEGLNAGP